MDNIQKLREKVEKDPKSTVFVRLAEELKKSGQLDEAIEVLKTGIEKQPGYMSARVALGKIYIEKEMPDEAKAEFMQVVEAAPDNLFARKKLAELYRTEGDVELAIEHYKKYLSLNPQDEEVQTICAELEKNPIPQAKVEKPAKEEPLDPSKRPSPLRGAMNKPAQSPKRTRPAAPAPTAPVARPLKAPAPEQAPEEPEIDAEDVYLESSPYEEEETEGFLSTLSDVEAGPEEESKEEPALSLQEKGGSTPGYGVEFKGFDLEGSGTPDMMQNDIDSMIEEVAGVPEESAAEAKAPLAGEPVAEDFGEIQFEGVAEEGGEEEADEQVGVVELSEEDAELGFELEGVPMGEEDEAGVGVVEISEEETAVELEGFTDAEPEGLVEPEMETAAPLPRPSAEAAPAVDLNEQFAQADALVEQEEYGKAFEIYRRLLTGGSDNPEVRQRVEELRGLIKLMGKDREIVEARLQAFLGSLQRKKHEFFGSS